MSEVPTWNGLLEQIDTCQKATSVAQRTAEVSVKQSHEVVSLATQSLSQIKISHDREVEKLKVENEQKVFRAQARLQEELQVFIDATQVATQRAMTARANKAAADERTRELEKEIAELNYLLDKTQFDADTRCDEAARAAEEKVQELHNWSNRRAGEIAAFIQQVQDAFSESMDMMSSQHKEAMESTMMGDANSQQEEASPVPELLTPKGRNSMATGELPPMPFTSGLCSTATPSSTSLVSSDLVHVP